MNLRILRIELRRSVARWVGAVVLLGTLGFVYGLSGPWWKGTELWTAQWTSAAWWMRFVLSFLWPLAVGAGALQGLRDHRCRMPELLAATPRPAWHRAAKTAGAVGLTLAAAYLLLTLLGAVHVLGNGGFFHLGWLPITLVGTLGLVAGAWLGMGVGRALPYPITPPVAAVSALVATVFLAVGRADTRSQVESAAPNRLTLLSPALPQMDSVFLTVAGRVSLVQAVWLLALAATGFLLLAATDRRSRLLALVPAALGVAVALPLLPADPARTFVADRAATAMVCRDRVCVTELHRRRLDEFAGPGREALRILAALPDAPRTVRESVTGWPPRGAGPRDADAVPLSFNDWYMMAADGDEITQVLLAGAGTAPCQGEGTPGALRELAARTVTVSWLLDDFEYLPGTTSWERSEVDSLAGPVWKKLRALPQNEQLARITALRKAALLCKGDLLDVLKGGGTR